MSDPKLLKLSRDEIGELLAFAQMLRKLYANGAISLGLFAKDEWVREQFEDKIQKIIELIQFDYTRIDPRLEMFDLRTARKFGVCLWADGTNGCYWVCSHDTSDPYRQELEFETREDARKWCDRYELPIHRDEGNLELSEQLLKRKK
jgi:hypothetical protein